MAPPRTFAVVNPAAGGGRVRREWPALLRALLDGTEGRLSVGWTTPTAPGTALTRHALKAGFERVAAVGGDGTLHAVVNGFFEDGAPVRPGAVLAPVTVGTGGDFRRSLGAATGPAAARRLAHAPVRRVDLGRVAFTATDGTRDRRVFANVASFGLSGRVVRSVARMPGRLRRLAGGRVAYLIAILRALATAGPVPVALSVDGAPFCARRVRVGAVANGSTFAGGLPIAPRARLDDGRLDLVTVGPLSVSGLLRRAGRFYRGTHADLQGIATARGRRLLARPIGPSPVALEADGEPLGHLPAVFETLPGVLRVQGGVSPRPASR